MKFVVESDLCRTFKANSFFLFDGLSFERDGQTVAKGISVNCEHTLTNHGIS